MKPSRPSPPNFVAVAKIVGDMALAIEKGEAKRADILAWAESLERVARELRALVQAQH